MPTPTTPTTPTRRRTREENAASLRRAAASVMPGIALVLRDGKDPSQYTHRSAYCFVDREEGKVWKCAGWKAPERKNPRSCIYDADHGASGVTGYGVNYLR